MNAPVTWRKAAHVLSALATIAKTDRILVFGSVAREGKGNDLDVVIEVSESVYITYLTSLWRDLYNSKDDYYANFCAQRVDAALAALAVSPAEYGWFASATALMGAPVDIHLMPKNWLDGMDSVQKHLPHNDPDFVKKIARDLRRAYFMSGPYGTQEWTGEIIRAIGSSPAR